MTRTIALCLALGTSSLLIGCSAAPTPATSNTPAPTSTIPATPTPSGSATAVAYNPENCFTQNIPGSVPAQSPRSLFVPDTLKLNIDVPSNFPNGRDPDDQVIDIELAFLLLDLSVSGQSLRTFANLPLNPMGNDKIYSLNFPYFAPPHGTPELALNTGTSFDFRTDPDSAYTSVDRMGQPAVATVLISTSQKNPYNDTGPTSDTAGTFRADQTASLTTLFNQIGDDLTALGLRICAQTS